VKSPYNEGVLMYFDEKIARYEVKKAVGLWQLPKLFDDCSLVLYNSLVFLTKGD
jgi:hypothetical protein